MSCDRPQLGFRYARGPRLQRQLFTWLALTILVTGLAIAGVFHLALPAQSRTGANIERVESFVAERFLENWEDPGRRQAVAESLSRALGATIRLKDAEEKQLFEVGGACRRTDRSLWLRRGSVTLGKLEACFHHSPVSQLSGILAFATAGLVLWGAAAVLARKLARPLSSLILVTREIGAGNLKSRVRLHRGRRGELGMLADAINDMAERIERQLNEQRELLAAVSHEVRSPLSRMRISSELLRDNPTDMRALTAIEQEISDIDALIGKLLASSRLDFGTLSRTRLKASTVASTALSRRQLPLTCFDDQSQGAEFSADPTLVTRALDNLLDNAEAHGKGVLRVCVRKAARGEHARPEVAVVFEVRDQGPGFAPAALKRAFEAFFRAPEADTTTRASLGLGLSLVQRIAVAHDGRAWAENCAEGGARVCFSVG